MYAVINGEETIIEFYVEEVSYQFPSYTCGSNTNTSSSSSFDSKAYVLSPFHNKKLKSA